MDRVSQVFDDGSGVDLRLFFDFFNDGGLFNNDALLILFWLFSLNGSLLFHLNRSSSNSRVNQLNFFLSRSFNNGFLQ